MKPTRSKHIRILAGALAVLTAEVATADVLTLQPVDDSYHQHLKWTD